MKTSQTPPKRPRQVAQVSNESRTYREAGRAGTSYRKVGDGRRGRSRNGLGICRAAVGRGLAQADNGAGSLELVDPNVFRACGDPRNLPFSNEKGEGFENKLAELFAAKLGKKLSYTYFPQATGFVTQDAGLVPLRCDHRVSRRATIRRR